VKHPLCGMAGHRLVREKWELDPLLFIVFRWRSCRCGKHMTVSDDVPQRGFLREPLMVVKP
jgi:hypothetical protein